MKVFIVIQSNPSNEGKTFVTKLQSTETVTDEVFGDKTKKVTYYISGTKQVGVGAKIPETALFPKYRVQEHQGINPETNEEIMLKWLHCA